ncbi:MAG: tRNA (adenosine(37)-N6)-threonylcarbamoyltransferase complex transferase subunit TsaD [Candidatus Pacebacteria bacterium]|nr:tRNA (adenosine(37)-N6)-threonylcarbamoyltransferase complex transferase subunit TsaD [Candidatus Paceibacterota bacterium]
MTKTKKNLTILGIDTSCDDTAISLLEVRGAGFNLLSNIVSSQVKLHAKYGGVYPSLAKREHQKNLVLVLEKALKGANLLVKNQRAKTQDASLIKKILEREETLKPRAEQFLRTYHKPELDYIAVTIGPGLEPCLWQGINFAKTLAYSWKLPIIPVNHVEAHLLANLLSSNTPFKFPAIGLVVSGGHTELVWMEKPNQYQIIGETLDDAAGECLDKTARILGLSYPGGPQIAKLAIGGKKLPVDLPRPMLKNPSFDFSFSGLKTAVLYYHQKQTAKIKKSPDYLKAMSREIQQAIIDVLIKKTLRAAKHYEAQTILLGGGVISNDELRKQLRQQTAKLNIDLLMPPREFCTDNAAMVSVTACYNMKKAVSWGSIKAQANLNI